MTECPTFAHFTLQRGQRSKHETRQTMTLVFRIHDTHEKETDLPDALSFVRVSVQINIFRLQVS
jgi:hypothetical protein